MRTYELSSSLEDAGSDGIQSQWVVGSRVGDASPSRCLDNGHPLLILLQK